MTVGSSREYSREGYKPLLSKEIVRGIDSIISIDSKQNSNKGEDNRKVLGGI
jgi:hypothetical protein